MPMKSCFDEIIDRRGTGSVKYGLAEKLGKPADILPLWVADMDFRSPPAVVEALKEAAEFGVFGYSDSGDAYFGAVRNWYRRRFGWEVDRSWLVETPGVVFAVCAAIRAFTSPGEAVMVQRPVYHPLFRSVSANGRVLVNNPLVYSDGAYSIDFADFESKIVRNHVKLFLLCSPHNPVGRVWTKAELTRLGEICVRHRVLVVADEIHADFVYPGNTHSVFASLKPEFLNCTVTCTAPSKTFNLAGLQASNIFIANPELRRRFREEIGRGGLADLNLMGVAACRAAYEHGEDWLEELKRYLAGNLGFLREFLKERIPRIRLVEPQGTYLLWLDCSGLGLSDAQLNRLLVRKARIWLNEGTLFGPEGSGFQRINIGCPRKILAEALSRLERAVNGGAETD